MVKIKIVLDADVIIHFSKGNMLSILPTIFTEYDFVLLDTVYKEIKEPVRHQLDNQKKLLKNISILPFNPKGEELKEYATLIQTKGKGESASLVYCRFNSDVIGSSNIKDITDYCDKYKMVYLTTIDFLYYAIKKNLVTLAEVNQFIQEVKKKRQQTA